MKKFVTWLWGNKQMITSAVTTSVSGLAAANMLSATVAVQVTTVTGVLMTAFAVAYTYFVAAPPSTPPDPPSAGTGT